MNSARNNFFFGKITNLTKFCTYCGMNMLLTFSADSNFSLMLSNSICFSSTFARSFACANSTLWSSPETYKSNTNLYYEAFKRDGLLLIAGMLKHFVMWLHKLKPWRSECNIAIHHRSSMLNATCWTRLATMLHHVEWCSTKFDFHQTFAWYNIVQHFRTPARVASHLSVKGNG